MVDSSGAIEQISFLTRSEPRVHILNYLVDSGSATQREFRAQLDTSRSTVTRSLTALEERDLVRKDGDAYHLTPRGRIVANGLCELVETVQATDELSTFIEWFPYAEYDLTLDQLRDAEVTASTDPDPYAPSRRHAAVLEVAETFRMLIPSIDLQLVKGTDDRIKAGELELELIIPPDMEETISTGEFAPALREQITAGGLTVLVCEEQVPFFLGLSDSGDVQIGVEDDEGFPRALIETDADDVRAWAESLYERYRSRSRIKPAEEF